MKGKTAFVLLSGVLSGSLCACAQPQEAAAPAASPPPPEGRRPRCTAAPGACASPGNPADARRPLGQHPGSDMRKAAGVIIRRSGRSIPVLYRLSGRAVR